MANPRISVIRGDIRTVMEGFVVHGTNDQGKYNAGVAKQIRNFWPNAYAAYMQQYYSGNLQLTKTSAALIDPRLCIVNACVQEGYGRDGVERVSYEAIGAAFSSAVLAHGRDSSLALVPTIFSFPAIGCGLGGGVWDKVESHILDNVPRNYELRLYQL